MGVIKLIGILFRALLANRAALAMENLALLPRYSRAAYRTVERFTPTPRHARRSQDEERLGAVRLSPAPLEKKTRPSTVRTILL